MSEETQSCRSEEGITVGLVDALISINRVLAVRDLSTSEVQEGLADLFEDPDLRTIRSAWRPTTEMWVGNADGEYVGVGEDLDTVMDVLKAQFAEDKGMTSEEADKRLGQDLKLKDYFVTLDGVRQRSYQAIRMNVLGG
jgi:hypothetical protein